MKTKLTPQIGSIVEVFDAETGAVRGTITKFHSDGSPMASFNGGPAVVLHADLFKLLPAAPAPLRAGIATGSLINHVVSGMRSAAPVVGMGATILGWTDRHACTIVKTIKRNVCVGLGDESVVHAVAVQADTAKRTDSNGMSEAQSYEFTRNHEACIEVFTLRKNGAWVREGEPMKSGQRLMIGERDQYYDFSF